MTAKNSHIVREFDTPLNVDQVANTRPATDADGTVLVEDSIINQSGEGITTGMSPSLETPDIFDNTPQAAIKPQTANQDYNDAVEVPVDPVATAATTQINSQQPQAVRTAATHEQVVTGSNQLAPNLDTLPDGSIDIRRQP